MARQTGGNDELSSRMVVNLAVKMALSRCTDEESP